MRLHRVGKQSGNGSGFSLLFLTKQLHTDLCFKHDCCNEYSLLWKIGNGRGHINDYNKCYVKGRA